jgi:hypothetical protein
VNDQWVHGDNTTSLAYAFHSRGIADMFLNFGVREHAKFVSVWHDA